MKLIVDRELLKAIRGANREAMYRLAKENPEWRCDTRTCSLTSSNRRGLRTRPSRTAARSATTSRGWTRSSALRDRGGGHRGGRTPKRNARELNDRRNWHHKLSASDAAASGIHVWRAHRFVRIVTARSGIPRGQGESRGRNRGYVRSYVYRLSEPHEHRKTLTKPHNSLTFFIRGFRRICCEAPIYSRYKNYQKILDMP